MVSAILQAKEKTILNENLCELASWNIGKIDFLTYLKSLKEHSSSIKVLKMPKVEMTDADFDVLLHWINTTGHNINVLVVTNNSLSDICIQGLINLLERNKRDGKL